jgi:spermidine synthase
VSNLLPDPISYFLGKHVATYQSKVSGKLEVWAYRGKKILYSENATQSFDSLHKLFQKVFPEAGIKKNMNNPPKSILLMGLGGGSVVSIIREELKIKAPIDAVEIDPIIISIAKEHFNIDRFEGLNIINEDAYTFVHHAQSTYDLIAIDIFTDDKVPVKFFEEKFNRALLTLLNPGGKLVFNIMVESAEYQQKAQHLSTLYANQPGLTVRVISPILYNNVMIVERRDTNNLG